MKKVSQEKILIGWASNSITPTRPSILAGQFHARVAKNVNDPITSTALAIESGNDQVIMVSCDLVAIRDGIQDRLRESLKSKLSDLGLSTFLCMSPFLPIS